MQHDKAMMQDDGAQVGRGTLHLHLGVKKVSGVNDLGYAEEKSKIHESNMG